MRSRAVEYHVYICGGGIGMFAGRSPIVCGLEGIARDEEQTANHANKLERIYGECRAGSVEHQQSNPLTLSARAPGFYTGRCTSLARMHFWRIASAKWQKPNRICVVVRAMRFCDFVMTIALRVWCGVWRDSCFAEVEFSLYGVVLWIFFCVSRPRMFGLEMRALFCVCGGSIFLLEIALGYVEYALFDQLCGVIYTCVWFIGADAKCRGSLRFLLIAYQDTI